MREYLTVLAAAAVTIAGALAIAPAQASTVKIPSISVDLADSGTQLVHERRYRQDGRRHRRYGHRRHHNRHYGGRRHYRSYSYYDYPRYYRSPGVTFQFGFGGYGHNGYGYGY